MAYVAQRKTQAAQISAQITITPKMLSYSHLETPQSMGKACIQDLENLLPASANMALGQLSHLLTIIGRMVFGIKWIAEYVDIARTAPRSLIYKSLIQFWNKL